MKGKTLKSAKGITLVALVVTIIVLLILAGVSINMVIGNNGIINRSREATKTYDEESVREELQLALVTMQMDKGGSLTTADVVAELNDYLDTDADDIQLSGSTVTVQLKGYEFEIDAGLGIASNGELTGALPSSFNFSVSPDNEIFDSSKVTITLTIGNPSDGTISSVQVPSGATQVASNNGETRLASQTPMSALNTYKYEVSANGTYKFTAITSMGRKQSVSIYVDKYYETETYSSEYSDITVQKDSEGNSYVIPKGFKVGTSSKINKVSRGLVVEGPDRSQWVWVPVNNVKEIMGTAEDMNDFQYFGRTKNIGWDNTWSISDLGYDDGYLQNMTASAGDIGMALNDSSKTNFNDLSLDRFDHLRRMYDSIAKYKGFYIARYESSYDSTNQILRSWIDASADCSNWYQQYGLSKNLYKTTSPKAVTTMIYGFQWDRVMEWMKDENSSEGIPYISIGTGTLPKIKNVYNIADNYTEWTNEQARNGSNYNTVLRGNHDGHGQYPAYRVIEDPSGSGLYTSRMQMFVMVDYY